MRAIPAHLALTALVVAHLPSVAVGQLPGADRPEEALLGGIGVGLPSNLYEGEIRSRGPTQVGRRGSTGVGTFVTEYRERMGVRKEVWGGLVHHLFDEHFVLLRGRWGSADSDARYRGGGALVEEFHRSVTWLGADLFFSAKLIDEDRFDGSLVAGPSFVRYDLTMASGGRDVIARKAGEVVGIDVTGPVTWSDRSWTSVNFVLGAEGRFRISPGVGLSVGLDGRILRTTGSAFEDAMKEDIAAVTGREPVLSFQGYSGWAPILTVGLEIGFPGGDPGAGEEEEDDDGAGEGDDPMVGALPVRPALR